MLGRDEVNDLEAILSISNSDVDEIQHTVRAHADALFTWDYERSKPALVKLYEKAKTSQWNGETDLDWSIEVDNEKLARENPHTPTVEGIAEFGIDLSGTVLATWNNDDWVKFEMVRCKYSGNLFNVSKLRFFTSKFKASDFELVKPYLITMPIIMPLNDRCH